MDMSGYTLLLALLATNFSLQTQPYGEAYKAFQEEGRPLVVLVTADWCPACQTMKSSNLPEAARRGLLKDVNVAIVDVDRSRALASQLMQGNAIPQLIMYYKTESGSKRVQLTGAQSLSSIERFVGRAFEEPSTAARPVETDEEALTANR
jgi:thioredoxin-like negative regulator of GroEL